MLLLATLAWAADPAQPGATGATTGAQPGAPAADKRVGLEAGLTLTLPLPPRGLGPGPGLRLLGDYEVIPRLTVGGELSARIPTGARGTLEDDALAEDLDWTASLVVLAGGARVAYEVLGAADGPRLRVALAGGVAWVSLDTVTQVGRTHDAALTGWVQPEVGGLFPLGPGELTADLLVPIAPAELLVLGKAPGGTGLGLAVGYRLGFQGGRGPTGERREPRERWRRGGHGGHPCSTGPPSATARRSRRPPLSDRSPLRDRQAVTEATPARQVSPP